MHLTQITPDLMQLLMTPACQNKSSSMGHAFLSSSVPIPFLLVPLFLYLPAAHGALGSGEASKGEYGQSDRGTKQTSHCICSLWMMGSVSCCGGVEREGVG